MARTLQEIYQEAKKQQSLNLHISEAENDSKMSLMNAILWTTSTCIWAFENILDVFKVDLALALENKVNGTPRYYLNALRKFQLGDELKMNEDGTQFSYEVINPKKCIITKASYSEENENSFHDKTLILKVAKDASQGNSEVLSADELKEVIKYINKISFAGTSVKVVSRKGDVLIPRLTVKYDGLVSEEAILNSIHAALTEFVGSISFDEEVYVQSIIDTIYHVNHVRDVYMTDGQGIFLVQYNDDNEMIPVEGKDGVYELKVGRTIKLNSGYLKESSRKGEEKNIDDWKTCIKLTT